MVVQSDGYLRTRSGRIYGKPIVVSSAKVSRTLKLVVERENQYDVDEPIPEECYAPDEFLDVPPKVSVLDDIDLIPQMDSVDIQGGETASTRMSGSKRRRNAKKNRHYKPDEHAQETVRAAARTPIPVDIDLHSLPSKQGAYGAKTTYYRYRDKIYTLQELLNMGFRLVKWDGIHPHPIVVEGRIIACLLGRPDDESYRVDCANAFTFITEIGDDAKFKKSHTAGKRGRFPAVNIGYAHGQGQTQPTRLNIGSFASFGERLLANKSIQRIMAFQSKAASFWAPQLFEYGSNVVTTMCDKLGIALNFPASIFPCVAFNFGRNVWTWLHQDVMNLAFFWCIITALGDFDAEKGGHLIMWDLKLVVEFPHAASIAIPSATITHSNIPVQAGDQRTSVTQFMPGGIARWVDNGCRTEKEMEMEDPVGYQKMQAAKAGRWRWGLSLWSKLEDIVASNLE